MGTTTFYPTGEIHEVWDDESRTYTEYATDGSVIRQEPYTPEQNAQADAEAAALVEEQNRERVLAKGQQWLDANTAFLAIADTATNAQLKAQVIALTKHDSAQIRAWMNDFSDVDEIVS